MRALEQKEQERHPPKTRESIGQIQKLVVETSNSGRTIDGNFNLATQRRGGIMGGLNSNQEQSFQKLLIPHAEMEISKKRSSP